MIRRIFVIFAVIALTGCGVGPSPWDRQVPEARKSPRPLVSRTVEIPPQVGEPVAGQPGASPYNLPADSGYGTIQGATDAQPFPGSQFPAMAPALPSVKVALLVPLSGPHKQIGEAMLDAAQIAVFDMGYEQFSLLPRDTKGTPQGAKQAVESAIASGAQLILGPLFSDEVRVVSPVARRHNVNIISFSTDWAQAGGNTFIMGFLPFSQIRRITEYAADSGIQRVGILAPNTGYGNAVIAAYNSLAYRMGLTTADVMRFPPEKEKLSETVRQFTRYDSRIDEEGQLLEEDILPFEAVLLPVGGEEAKSVASLLSFYEMGPRKVQRLGTGLWDDKSLATEPSLDGAWFAAPSPELRKEFERRYSQLYGNRPPRLATLAYDATALSAVLARTGYERSGKPAFDRSYLTNPNGFAGLDGVFRFRPDGIVERGLAVLQFVDGDIVIREPAPRTFERWIGQ